MKTEFRHKRILSWETPKRHWRDIEETRVERHGSYRRCRGTRNKGLDITTNFIWQGKIVTWWLLKYYSNMSCSTSSGSSLTQLLTQICTHVNTKAQLFWRAVTSPVWIFSMMKYWPRCPAVQFPNLLYTACITGPRSCACPRFGGSSSQLQGLPHHHDPSIVMQSGQSINSMFKCWTSQYHQCISILSLIVIKIINKINKILTILWLNHQNVYIQQAHNEDRKGSLGNLWTERTRLSSFTGERSPAS